MKKIFKLIELLGNSHFFNNNDNFKKNIIDRSNFSEDFKLKTKYINDEVLSLILNNNYGIEDKINFLFKKKQEIVDEAKFHLIDNVDVEYLDKNFNKILKKAVLSYIKNRNSVQLEHCESLVLNTEKILNYELNYYKNKFAKNKI